MVREEMYDKIPVLVIVREDRVLDTAPVTVTLTLIRINKRVYHPVINLKVCRINTHRIFAFVSYSPSCNLRKGDLHRNKIITKIIFSLPLFEL